LILSATLLEDALFRVGSDLLVQKFGMRAVLIGASALIAICGCILICNCPQWLIVTALVFGIVRTWIDDACDDCQISAAYNQGDGCQANRANCQKESFRHHNAQLCHLWN
jgi:hypothetical protein